MNWPINRPLKYFFYKHFVEFNFKATHNVSNHYLSISVANDTSTPLSNQSNKKLGQKANREIS